MIEKLVKKKSFKWGIYLIGGLLEILGFGLLFAPDKIILMLSQAPTIFSLLTIVAGYLVAVSVRK